MKTYCSTVVLIVLGSLALSSTSGADTVSVGGRAAPKTPGDVYWRRFAESVDAATEGRTKVRLFIRGEIGPEETQFAHLRRGRRVQLAGISTTTVSQVIPALDILRLPFLFDNLAEVGYVLDNHLKVPLQELLLDHDLVMIDWMSAGWLNLYAKAPMRHPDNIAQQRIRINASPAALLFMQAVDADIVPISFSEIVTALQTGLIDGGEQSTQLFVTGGMGKFAPHFSRTQHAFLTALIVANRGWFEGLSEAEREIYRQAVPSDQWYRHYFSEQNAPLLRQAVEDGLTVHDLSADERAAWRERTQTIAEDLIAEIGPEAQMLYDIILEGKTAFAAQQDAAE